MASDDDVRLAARAAALTQQQWPLLLVLVVMLVGLIVVWWSWPVGCLIIAGGVCLGALLRLTLPRRWAGLLIVRNRVFDVLFMTLVGVGLIALVLSRV